MLQRNISFLLHDVLEKYGKMAFLSGPRQVGKTTIANAYLKGFSQGMYFSWDAIPDQKKLLKDPYFFEKAIREPKKPFLIVLDEIHKYARWKNYLKGAYDQYHQEFRFLITGSGRLDLFKRGGDSLLGRYMGIPLLPFTLGEVMEDFPRWERFLSSLLDVPGQKQGQREAYETLFYFSGFPEPFVRAEKTFYNRWFQDRKTLLIREDIRDATRLREISLMEMLSHMIPVRVGSLLSLNALREDLGVAFDSVREWVILLEQFYYLFRIYPFAGTLPRSLKKEAKAYLYDWAEVLDEGARFENLVAVHLYKAVQLWNASGEARLTLHYMRDKDKREVDFALVENGRKIMCLIECKLGDDGLSPSLLYFQRKLSVPIAVQLVHKKGVIKKTGMDGRIQWVVSADRWLESLP